MGLTERIKYYLDVRQMTVRELAIGSGLSETAIYQIFKKGKTGTETLGKIAHALDIPTHVLLMETDDPPELYRVRQNNKQLGLRNSNKQVTNIAHSDCLQQLEMALQQIKTLEGYLEEKDKRIADKERIISFLERQQPG